MLARKWFYVQSNNVKGPLDVSELENSLQSLGSTVLIWGRGLSEWVPPDKWREFVRLESQNQAAQEPVEPMWKYRYGKKEFGPLSFHDLIENLRKLPDPQTLSLWSDEFNEWREIYLVAKVADELGVSRRSFARVPIMGNLKCDTEAGVIDVKVISISEGGIGTSHSENLVPKEKFKAVLTSPNLFLSINCHVEVMHVTKDGVAGLRFVNLPIEAKSAIIEYVNKFREANKI